MQVLIAHGDASARAAFARIAACVAAHGLEVVECDDGQEALQLLLADDGPRLAVVDWDLPGLDGLEICRLVSQFDDPASPYVILLARGSQSLAEGLDAGAGDCVRTPVDAEELRARIDAGRRLVLRFAPNEVSTASLEADLRVLGEDNADDPGSPGGRLPALPAPSDASTVSLEAEIKAFRDDDEGDAGFVGGATLESVLVAD